MINEKLTVGGEILGNYWPKETIYVKEDYKTIPFPFKEITIPKLEMKVNWSFDDLFTYMETWSSVKKFQMEKKYDPLSIVREEMKSLWGKKEGCEMEYKPQGRVYPKISLAAPLFVLSRL
jgi:hypothetical protein